MLVPDQVRRMPGVAIVHRAIQHEACGGKFIFDAVAYVNLGEWSQFRQSLEGDQLGNIECDRCGEIATVQFPVIIEIPRCKLLVFATHGGDDGGVGLGLAAVLEEAAVLLSPHTVERARQLPYTFVHGYRGARVLLNALDGEPVPPPAPPYAHAPDDGQSFTMLRGYKYGELYFHYPAQHTVHDFICALVHWSADIELTAEFEAFAEVGESIIRTIGPHHPWLLHELGRAYIELGRLNDAQRALEMAALAQHCWLAVTVNVLDATPSTRADAVPQNARLPHAEPASALSDVTTTRHTALRHRPAYKDYGLWHFPTTEQYSYPPSYTTATVHSARGLAVGYLSRYFVDQKRLASTEFWITLSDVLRETKRNIEAIMDPANRAVGVIHPGSKYIEALPDPEPAVREFWRQYVFARWLSQPGSSIAGQSRGQLLGLIKASMSNLEQGDAIGRFYLDGSAEAIMTSL